MVLVEAIYKPHSTFVWVHLTIGMIMLLLINGAHSVSVPDTKGTSFLFSAPVCSSDFPAQIHVIPQTTDALNVTLEEFDGNSQYTKSEYTIKTQESLHLTLPCTTFVWDTARSADFILESTSEVSVYIDLKDDNYLLFPSDTFGHHYVVSTVPIKTLTETFFIVHGNNSQVEVTLPAGIQSHVSISGNQYQGGESINISLPTNGVIGIKCSCDLTGATINSALPISVLVGSMDSASNSAALEQLPAKDTRGRKFIFSNSRWFAQNITLQLYGEAPNTEVTITTKEKIEKSTFQSILVLSMQLDFSDFLSVETNNSVSCVIMHEVLDLQITGHMTMLFLTPIVLFHLSSTFTFNTSDAFTVNLIVTSDSFQYISLNKSDGELFNKAMTFWWNYFICKDNTLSQPQRITTNANNAVPFYGTILRRNDKSAYEYSLGMRITSIYDACVENIRPHGGNGDGVDNDCDNRIDEEILNNIDDDNDGLVDEDVGYSGTISHHSSESAVEYHVKHREKEERFSSSVVSVVIPLSAAVTLVILLIVGMIIADKIRRMNSSTRISPLYLQQQQEPILQRY